MAPNFDFKALPEEQQVAFYGCLFALAGADGGVEQDEVASIFETLDTDGMSESGRQKIHSFLLQPPPFDDNLDVIAKGAAELRYGFVVAMMDVALADGDLTAAEQGLLEKACDRLAVTSEQVAAIKRFVHEVRRIRDRGLDDNVAVEAMKSAAAGLGAVGIPLAAVYFSGTVVGLSAAGITSGLAALGLGLGMFAGIGIAILIGTGVFVGTRWVLDSGNQRKRAHLQAERERRAQLVIKNLQDAIDVIIARLHDLQAAADMARANDQSIRALMQRLEVLQALLRKRKGEAAA